MEMLLLFTSFVLVNLYTGFNFVHLLSDVFAFVSLSACNGIFSQSVPAFLMLRIYSEILFTYQKHAFVQSFR